ncbi:MAG: S26 family signal peptidase [Azonexus sp.]|jgi:conjugal transfer pilin signal peptidase TrbI|nr:S26 family signal peptidase [Azonexus sp.]
MNPASFISRRVVESIGFAKLLIKRWYITLPIVVGYGVVQHFLYVNITSSLPYTLVWLDYSATPEKGDLVVYRYAGTPWPEYGYLDGVRFFKRVAGVEGDTVGVSAERVVTVGSTTIGYAKPKTKKGDSLEPIAEGVIPHGYFFAQADTPDSFDSRYRSSGLIPIDRVIGVAHPIF